MTVDAWLTLGLIAVLLVLLVWGRFPTWAVFAGTLAAILTLGLAPESEALSGFSNAGVLSVVVLYVVAEGMYRTGAISLIIDRVVGMPGSERAANLRILPVTAVGSAFINNTPIVAMLVPVVADLGRSAKLAVSRIYMGVSNASVLGGSTTLIGTSTNLIIAGLVLATYGVELRVFFPTAVGLPAAVVGVVLMLLLADRLLGKGPAEQEAGGAPKSRYRAEFVVTGGSPLVGRTLARAGLAEPTGGRLLDITRDGRDDRRAATGTGPWPRGTRSRSTPRSRPSDSCGRRSAWPPRTRRRSRGTSMRPASSRVSSPSTRPTSLVWRASWRAPAGRSSRCPAGRRRSCRLSRRSSWRRATGSCSRWTQRTRTSARTASR